MAVETAFVSYGGTGQGVLQSLDRTLVTGTRFSISQFGAVLLHKRLELGLARVERASEIECDVGVVCGMRLAILARPVVKQLPLVGSFFRHFNRVFLHIRCTLGCNGVQFMPRFGSNGPE